MTNFEQDLQKQAPARQNETQSRVVKEVLKSQDPDTMQDLTVGSSEKAKDLNG